VDYEFADALNTMAPRKVRITLTLSSDILKKLIGRPLALAKISRSAYIEAVLRRYLSIRERLAQMKASD
jgi:metal-responsive CopG/Arc/MetJ family transcriptional regulator